MASVTLTFPDGNARDYDAGVTPAQVAQSISKSLAKKAISATVNGAHHDLQWPIDADASIALHTMADEEQANELVRHDLAHIMARAVQEIWPDTKVTIGPVIKDGWYYDFDRKTAFTPEDLGTIEKKMKEIINKREPVRTEVWDRARAIAHYEANGEPYKVELIDSIPGDEPLRMYWHGDWQDLCRGPHLQHTGQVPGDSFKLMSIAGAYWRGDSDREMLQRIYGVAFTGKEKLKAHLHMLEEAAKRDHRKLGREMDLFHMQEEAPGQIFWHPNGWTHLHRLAGLHAPQTARGRLCRGEHTAGREPQTVGSIRPLGELSGPHVHRRSRRRTCARKTVNALKPMNCPCHVQIFNTGMKSYRDLPLRMAEFGRATAMSRQARCTASCGSAALPRMTAIFSVPRIRSRRKRRSSSSFLPMSTTIWGSNDCHINVRTAPKSGSGPRKAGTASRPRWMRVTRQAMNRALEPGEGAFYGPKLEFTLTRRDWPRMAVRHLAG